MFSFQDSRGSVEVAFTDRHGPFRDGPSARLDLTEPPAGESRPDEQPGDLATNIQAVLRGLADGGGESPRVVRMRQVHGADVRTVDATLLARAEGDPPVADALVTDLPGVVLLARAADCVPVLLADPERGVVGAVHSGRQGLVAGVVPATVARMRELGAADLVAWVGPHVCGRCYEVPADMRDSVAAAVPESYAETSWGTPAVDVGAGVVAQLKAAGVEVVDAARCTMEDDDLYSYRRQGAAAGRLGGLIWRRA